MDLKKIKGLKRDTIDKFYTKLEVVKLCFKFISDNLEITTNDIIIEPSAGNGAFIEEIKKISNNYEFYDLEPEHPEIIKQDYLLYSLSKLSKENKIHIIGNPPFGRQSSSAIKFIRKSCEFCDTISFILPRSFKKDSLKIKFPLNFHLKFEIDLPDNSFLLDINEYNVPCIFQIWEKKDYNRIIKDKLEPFNFKFVKKEENHDISIRRVGGTAGTIDIKTDNKNIQSHYFIKFLNDNSIKENIELLKKIEYDFNNTVGPKSISKQEIISKFNENMK
jgi:hypothetical protein